MKIKVLPQLTQALSLSILLFYLTLTLVSPIKAIASTNCSGITSLDCTNVPELLCKTACNQHQSLTIRDRCSYHQKLHMERYDKPKELGQPLGKRKQLRDTEVVIKYRPDDADSSNYLVISEVVADTDDEGNPKTKVDPKANTGLTSQAFLDLIFFPLLPEKLPYYEFEQIAAEREGEQAYKFKPKSNVRGIPLAAGIVYVSTSTGEMLTAKIEAMHNLEVLDKHLKDLESINATVDFSQFNDKYRMPTLARGEGMSNVSRFKGAFKFSFEESRYVPVLNMPRWSGIKTSQ